MYADQIEDADRREHVAQVKSKKGLKGRTKMVPSKILLRDRVGSGPGLGLGKVVVGAGKVKRNQPKAKLTLLSRLS